MHTEGGLLHLAVTHIHFQLSYLTQYGPQLKEQKTTQPDNIAERREGFKVIHPPGKLTESWKCDTNTTETSIIHTVITL